MFSGGKRVISTTEDNRKIVQINLILLKLSLKKKNAKAVTNTVLSERMAPTIPPFIPASKVASKAIVDDCAPRYSKAPPIKVHNRSLLFVSTTSPKAVLLNFYQGNMYFYRLVRFFIALPMK